MRRNIKFLTVLSLLIVVQVACNLPTGSGTSNAAATLQAITTAQAATLQAMQTAGTTPTLSSLPTLVLPTLPVLNTPAPTSQSPVNTPVVPVSYCNWAAYVKDVTIPDGTTFAPGSQFTKTWRLQNIGTCAWTTSYDLVFSSGERMGNAVAVDLPTTVYPNQVVDVSVNLVAPGTEGKHRGYWGLRSDAGVIFGIGNNAKEAFYVDIKVVGSMTTVFDFAAEYCHADWRSDAGDLGCPGNEGGKKGYVLQVEDPQLENGAGFDGLGILMVPQRVYNGYLEGQYQAFDVRTGDRFRGIINCAYKSSGCNVLFRIGYRFEGEQKVFWQFFEEYEGKYYSVDLDLSSLAGKRVKFILAVLANGDAENDKPIWVAPRIDRPSHLVTKEPTSTNAPTKTITPTDVFTSTVTPTETLTATPTVTVTPTP